MEALSAVRHSLAALRSPNLSLLTLNFWHDDSWITRDKGQGRFPRSLWIMKACHLPLIYFFLPQLDRVCHGCERQHLQTTRDIWASLLFANVPPPFSVFIIHSQNLTYSFLHRPQYLFRKDFDSSLSVYPRLASKLWSSCLSLPSVRLTGKGHYA